MFCTERCSCNQDGHDSGKCDKNFHFENIIEEPEQPKTTFRKFDEDVFACQKKFLLSIVKHHSKPQFSIMWRLCQL